MSVLIVDDEAIARNRVRLLLSRDPQIRVVGECASVDQCEQLDASIVPDLVFLDVRMPDRDGFALLEMLDARGTRPLVIVTAAHSMYALEAYEAGAIDYLLKPFDDERFAKALARAKAAALYIQRNMVDVSAQQSGAEELKPRLDRLIVSEDNRILLIPTGDIELIQVVGKYVKIFARGHCHVTRQSLRSMEDCLDKLRFVRVHRSTVVNIDQIVELHPLLHGDCEVVLKRGTRITVSRRFRSRPQPFLVRWSEFRVTSSGSAER